MKTLKMLLEVGGREHNAARIVSGSRAQDMVIADLQQRFGDKFELLSTAAPGSQRPDIIANINGQRVQFEVKNRNDKNQYITMYNTTILPTEENIQLNTFSRLLSSGTAKNFNELMDQHKGDNPTAGWPHEKQSPKSGSINVRTTDSGMISRIRQQLVGMMKRSRDDYFVVVNFNDGSINYYDIGKHNIIPEATPFPKPVRVILKTDGAPYKHKMRVGLKVNLP